MSQIVLNYCLACNKVKDGFEYQSIIKGDSVTFKLCHTCYNLHIGRFQSKENI